MFKDLIVNQAIIVSITGLILSVISPQTKPTRQRALLYAFNISTIILALTVAIFSHHENVESANTLFQILAVGAIALFTPLYYYNIKIIVLPKSQILTKLLWWELPGAAFIVLSIVWHNTAFSVIFITSLVLLSSIIIVKTLQELKKTTGNVGNMSKGQVIVAAVVPLLIISCIVLSPADKTPLFFIGDAISILCSTAVGIVTYNNLKQYLNEHVPEKTTGNAKVNEAKPCVIQPSEISPIDENMVFLANRIIEIVEKNQMFLKTDLRVTDIAIKLSTNRTYISQAINQKLGYSFSDFINSHRIEFAKQLLSQPQNYKFTIEAIAEDSGFCNVTSLNRAFKAKLNVTPHQYRQNIICTEQQHPELT